MRLLNLTATAHPQGNRIDLSFLNPHPALYSQIQIRRGTYSHPTRFTDGQLVQEVKLSARLTWQPAGTDCIEKLDQAELCEELRTQLISQEIILTAAPLLTPLTTEEPWRRWQLTDHDQDYVLSYHPATNTLQVHEYKIIFVKDAPLQSETVYYYTLFTFPEPYFDPQQRVSAMATGPYQFGEQLYQLLPHLYHRYDTTISPAAAEPTLGQLRRWLELPGMQLDQIYSFATALLKLADCEQVEGSLLPLLAQWIGWQLDRNQAVATWRNEIRGAPELYRTIGIIPTVESAVKRLLGWESRIKEYHYNILRTNVPERFNLWERVDSKASLLSLDFAYEGRPAVVTTTETSWLFYHTWRHQQWEISYKTLTNEQWSPSQPLTVNSAFINKHPTAVSWQNQLWVFWNAYDETQSQWQIHYCYQLADKTWSPVYRFDSTPDAVERQQPAAVVDDAQHLWLFWLEKPLSTSWELKYARLDNPASILEPVDGTATGQVGIQDLFVLFHPNRKEFWVFWSERQLTPAVAADAAVPAEAKLIPPCRPVTAQTPNQTHWQISYQVLDSTNPTWGESQALPRPAPPNAPAAYDDREPAAVVNNSGQIELVWSSNRGSSYSGGSWSIWRQLLDPQTGTGLETAEMFTRDPYSQRAPMLMKLPGDSVRMIYRSNESLTYQSERYGATQTTDFRYAGCTTVDTCNQTKNSLREQFGDFQSYTIDTGHNAQGSYENNKYARGKIGIFLTPGSQNVAINYKVLKTSLTAFLPLPVRPLLFIDSDFHDEWFYTYQAPAGISQRVIAEQWFDRIGPMLTRERYRAVKDNYQDKVPQWSWLYTAWTAGGTNPWTAAHRTVNFGAEPPPALVTRFRSWHLGVATTP